MQLDHPSPLIDFEALAKAQPTDDDLDRLQSATSALKLERIPIPMCRDTLLCDTSTGTPRPYIPIPDSTADTVAQAFISGWVSRFGVPSTITMDRGQQFKSTLWKHLMHLLGTHHIRSTAYHPISNGLVEYFHRQLKCLPETTHWTKALPLILLGIRTAIK